MYLTREQRGIIEESEAGADLQCSRCGAKEQKAKAEYEWQMGDEPLRTFLECQDCGHELEIHFSLEEARSIGIRPATDYS